MEENRITIIEGPPPVFEPVRDGWALGLGEGPRYNITVLTRLRTFNGPALVERCYRAWNTGDHIHLHYRNDLGLEQKAPIIAVRSMESPEGNMLMLWLNLDSERVEYEYNSNDDDDLEDNPGNLN